MQACKDSESSVSVNTPLPLVLTHAGCGVITLNGDQSPNTIQQTNIYRTGVNGSSVGACGGWTPLVNAVVWVCMWTVTMS